MRRNNEIMDELIGALYTENIERLRKLLEKYSYLSNEPLNNVFLKKIIECTSRQHKGEKFDLLVNFINSGSGAEHNLERQLIIEVLKGNVESAGSLLKKGANIKCPEWRDLLSHIYDRLFSESDPNVRREMLTLLLDHGLNSGFRTRYRNNLLHIFFIYYMKKKIDHDAVQIAKILIDYGVSVNEFNNHGITPLRRSVSMNNVALVSLLIENGADVNAKNSDQETALHEAVMQQNLKIINLLLSRGADVNAKCLKQHFILALTSGWTPLHLACAYQNEKLIELLLQHGADISIKSKNGETTLSMMNRIHAGYPEMCLRAMVKEFSKFIFKNLPVCEDDVKLLKSIPAAQEHLDKCASELAKMSSTKFYGSYSHYSVLKMSRNIKKLALLTKNKKFLKEFEVSLNEFCYYQDDLRVILSKAIQVREKLDVVHHRLLYIFKDSFPDVVIRKMSEHLRVQDLPEI